mgnify:CR=1 FL=1|tara:strand:+ start:2743 stop:2952 length:210 start_codon:yes stop_codon:yes gene_type:complete
MSSEYIVISKSGPDGNAINIMNKAVQVMKGLSFPKEDINNKLESWQNSTYQDIIDDIEDFLDGYIEFVE